MLTKAQEKARVEGLERFRQDVMDALDALPGESDERLVGKVQRARNAEVAWAESKGCETVRVFRSAADEDLLEHLGEAMDTAGDDFVVVLMSGAELDCGPMKIPCLQCFGFIDEHEGGKCPGRPLDAADYADRQLRRKLPAVWDAKRVLFELFPGLRPGPGGDE